MTGLVKSNVTYSFTYNDEGIRTTKTKAGVTTTYYLSGSQIIGEETNGNITLYVYDSDGAPLGMQYHAASYAEDIWDVYWFEKNLFGDVVAVYDETGTKLISYEYNAYGNWWSMQYNGGYSTTAYNNPFRYRGYYYDRDLELYVLNSRYYDPYTGRFISPDDVSYLGANGDLNSYNLYAYCSNNPIALSYVCLGNSRNIGFTSCSVTSNACVVTSSHISPVNYGLNFDFIVNGVSTISTIHGWYQAASKLVNHVNYFYNNMKPFENDMKVIGISTTKGVLAFNNFTWKLGKSDAFSVLLGVGFDVYDSIQNEASSGEMLLSASLTAVKGVGMIYLNKVIVYGVTTAGSAICPGPGTAIGFVVGEVICIIVDIAASNLLDELIDEIVN
jgi:RHS repeat-associated protein